MKNLGCLLLVFVAFLKVYAVESEPQSIVPGTIKVSLFHDGYVVHDENDGLLGNGVDLYVGWMVTSEAGVRGGVGPVSDGLTNDNGKPINADGTGNRKSHPRDDLLCEVSLPPDQIVFFDLYLIESDKTTEAIKARFEACKFPNFSEGAPSKFNFNFYVGNDEKNKLRNARNLLSLKSLLQGENSDDGYGHWVVELANVGGVIQTAAVLTESTSDNMGDEVRLVSPPAALKPGAPKSNLLHLFFKDKENAITTGVDAVATLEGGKTGK